MGSHSPIKKGTSDTVTWGSGLWGKSDVPSFYIVTCLKNNSRFLKVPLVQLVEYSGSYRKMRVRVLQGSWLLKIERKFDTLYR